MKLARITNAEYDADNSQRFWPSRAGRYCRELLDGCDAIADMAAFVASEFYRLAIHSGEHLATSQPWRKARRTGK